MLNFLKIVYKLDTNYNDNKNTIYLWNLKTTVCCKFKGALKTVCQCRVYKGYFNFLKWQARLKTQNESAR